MLANDLRPGNSIMHNGTIHVILEASHRSPGNKRAFIQVSMRNLKSGKIIQEKFSSTEAVDPAPLEARKAQFLYSDDGGFHFMDQTDFETHTIGPGIVGEKKNFLKENCEVRVFYHENIPVDLELPPKMALEVTEAPDWVRGDSVSNNVKPVVLETGFKINVPIFIKQGTKIVVDTRSGEYISRE
ncbi:MAG: elongation factor P [Candidatus Omnitrophica bacterium]|nr:elongation factor P [Candidatus Omnitrophota bacterium]